MKYTVSGVCARGVQFDIEDGIVKNVAFEGGCNGNTKGVAALANDMKVEDVIARLRGIRCGSKMTSCPDQLARALEKALQEGK